LYSVPSTLLAFLSGVLLRVLVADSTLLGHGHENVQTWKKSKKSTIGKDYTGMFYMNHSQLVTGAFYMLRSHTCHAGVMMRMCRIGKPKRLVPSSTLL
jgi:hypothetical protein